MELNGDLLVCTECQYAYRIEDGIPDMLPESAIPPDEWKREANSSHA